MKKNIFTNQYGVTPFAGADFSNWIFRIKTILEEKQLLKYINQNIKSKELNETEQIENARTKNILIQCISDNYLEIIKDCTLAIEIVEKLEKIFVRTGISSQLLIPTQKIAYNEV